MTLTAKQRIVLEMVDEWAVEPGSPAWLIHFHMHFDYLRRGYELEASADIIRDQLRRLVAKKLVLKRSAGYVISARGRKALESS